MSNKLVEENARLHQQLNELLAQARRNQDIMQRYQAFDLKLIGASTFQELLDSIFETLIEASELDVVTLTLIDPEQEVRRILAELRIEVNEYPNLIFVDDDDTAGETMRTLRKPLLGAYSARSHAPLFPKTVLKPASVAVLPLVRRDRLIGWLSLGSLDAARFASNMASDFQQHRASVVAICVENVINNERLQHIGLTDPLTGVHNRRYVERRLLEEIVRTQRHGYPLSCLYIDLDHFKAVNDTHGHRGGDEVLREVSARIKHELRLSDALGRFGGEEFVVLLIDTPHAAALAVAERIVSGIRGRTVVLESGDRLQATVSVGVATLETAPRADDPAVLGQMLLERADAALYRAKKAGRDCVVSAFERG
ncbi:hypothetical protein GCM10007205_15350 [Oxalicibacterium flavum]|uniref:diguanylate cyclase n=1 Tax=Oxalicibacterium flavum TaxID=179467 RepID=A0A8J2XZ79_9BURK|nr:sensor domain-containing diguanylate cyclase [Oxalicibacterium flavum]GGC07041.1 hypothetical protein GCM10007205_15350 [Oxalicibacterium flavum]